MDDGPFHTAISTELRDEKFLVTVLRFLTLTLAPSGVDRWFVQNDMNIYTIFYFFQYVSTSS